MLQLPADPHNASSNPNSYFPPTDAVAIAGTVTMTVTITDWSARVGVHPDHRCARAYGHEDRVRRGEGALEGPGAQEEGRGPWEQDHRPRHNRGWWQGRRQGCQWRLWRWRWRWSREQGSDKSAQCVPYQEQSHLTTHSCTGYALRVHVSVRRVAIARPDVNVSSK